MKRSVTHWADRAAMNIIREKGEKERYVCASGVTPSGTVHIGNFREIVSVDLVVKALQEMGKGTRFIYSWDDYDVFRKVPLNMPKREELEQYLRMPITLTPDPYGEYESYARRNEIEVEKLLPQLGIKPEYLYQAERYRKSIYAEGIRKALLKRERIREILNEHRTTPLGKDWWPITVFCDSCNRDTTVIDSWDGEWKVSYHCNSCNNRETVDLRKASSVKLLWRVDWPMRWEYEKVDFEPAGKDHHSQGGSFDTAKRIVREVYNYEPPVTFQYDFIGIKGRGGKISSSTGEVVSLKDVLEVYQPEVVRYMFAGTKPNSEFVISFDLDVIKIYEDYDRCERIYFGVEDVSEKRREKEKRIYELSQVDGKVGILPYQVPFRHLCNVTQIYEGDIDGVLSFLEAQAERDGKKENFTVSLERIRKRSICAWNWVRIFSPDSFRFRLKKKDEKPVELTGEEKNALYALRDELSERFDSMGEKELSGIFYEIAGRSDMEPKDFFKVMYRVLIGKDKGPRLASFILTIGRKRILEILDSY